VTPLLTSLIAFLCIFGGTFLGMFLRNRLPERHLSGDTRDVVRLGTGLIATLPSLVLGLLIGSANETFETQSGQVKQLTATIVLLDGTLSLYGPETGPIRALLRRDLVVVADRIWSENGLGAAKVKTFEASSGGVSLYHEILKLSPMSDEQRFLQARAADAITDIGKTRLLLFAKAGRSIPIPFLVVLISWLMIIFASFSLFAEGNASTIAVLCIFSLSATAAIFLILELSQPFTGLMMISDEPLRNALPALNS
jgi:Protein of unknown function (DUF4239)